MSACCWSSSYCACVNGAHLPLIAACCCASSPALRTKRTKRRAKLGGLDRDACGQLHAAAERGKKRERKSEQSDEAGGALRMEGGLRGERRGAAEWEEGGGGGAVVGCRRQGGKGHRHICLALSLSLLWLRLLRSGRSLLMFRAFAFYLAGSVSFPVSRSLRAALVPCAVLCFARREEGMEDEVEDGRPWPCRLAPYRRRAVCDETDTGRVPAKDKAPALPFHHPIFLLVCLLSLPRLPGFACCSLFFSIVLCAKGAAPQRVGKQQDRCACGPQVAATGTGVGPSPVPPAGGLWRPCCAPVTDVGKSRIICLCFPPAAVHGSTQPRSSSQTHRTGAVLASLSARVTANWKKRVLCIECGA